MPKRTILVVGALLWLACVGVGMRALLRYSNTPGEAARAPRVWPAGTSLERKSGRHTLVVVAHPACPCTRATIGELAKILTRASDRLRTYVLFVKPPGAADGFEQTDLWRSASALAGVTVVRDDGGVEAERFGAATSGQALLFDPDGRLEFSGGITGGRGHAGDNLGSARVLSLVKTGSADAHGSDVYGCALVDHEYDPERGGGRP